MSTYLILAPLPADRSDLAEGLLRSAVCFFEAQGFAPTRTNVGNFARVRAGSSEILKLVTLRTTVSAADVDELARALEGVLRTTLTVAKARAGELRVFVASSLPVATTEDE